MGEDLINNEFDITPQKPLSAEELTDNAYFFLSDFTRPSYKRHLNPNVPSYSYTDPEKIRSGYYNDSGIYLNDAFPEYAMLSSAVHEYEHDTLKNYHDNNFRNKYWNNRFDGTLKKLARLNNKINLAGSESGFDKFRRNIYLNRLQKFNSRSNNFYNPYYTRLINRTFDLDNDTFSLPIEGIYDPIRERGSTLREAQYAIQKLADSEGISYRKMLRTLRNQNALKDFISNTNAYGESYIDRLNLNRLDKTNLLLDIMSKRRINNSWDRFNRNWDRITMRLLDKFNRNLYRGLLRFRKDGGTLNYLNYTK